MALLSEPPGGLFTFRYCKTQSRTVNNLSLRMELLEDPIYERMFHSTVGESGAEIPSWVNGVKAV